MGKKEIQKILEQHKRYLLGKKDGVRAYLRWVDLQGAYLRWADLQGAYLQGADLRGADLRWVDLQGAYLRWADLRGADLQGAYLQGAYLRWADLRGADLQGADLRGADLRGAYIEFYQFPSIRLLSSIYLGSLPHELSTELMRRDAQAHPYPGKFIKWAKGGPCPYQNEERFWQFNERREDWKRGNPKIQDRDLIKRICKEKGWKIKGYKL